MTIIKGEIDDKFIKNIKKSKRLLLMQKIDFLPEHRKNHLQNGMSNYILYH